MYIFISDKLNYRIKKITRDRRKLFNDKSFNSPRRHNNLKKVCTKKKIALNTWAKTQRNKKRNDISTIVVGKFKNSLSESDKPTRQKITKDI